MTDPLEQALQNHRFRRRQAAALIGPTPQPAEPPRIPRNQHAARDNRHLIIQLLRQRDGTACYLCKTDLDIDQSCVEHIIPISQGGENEPHNVAISCIPCNTRKAGLYVAIHATSGRPVYHQPR